jgi:hypothetical protein
MPGGWGFQISRQLACEYGQVVNFLIRIICCIIMENSIIIFFSSGPRAYAPDAAQPVGLLCSSSMLPERPLAAKGGTALARIMADNFA